MQRLIETKEKTIIFGIKKRIVTQSGIVTKEKKKIIANKRKNGMQRLIETKEITIIFGIKKRIVTQSGIVNVEKTKITDNQNKSATLKEEMINAILTLTFGNKNETRIDNEDSSHVIVRKKLLKSTLKESRMDLIMCAFVVEDFSLDAVWLSS